MNLFEDKPNYESEKFPPPREFQVSAHEKLRDGVRKGNRAQVLMAPTGAGKCLKIGTPVMLSDGTIIPVERIMVGDRLLGPDGKVRNVLTTTSGTEMLYRITPKKGDSYVVNESHILSLRKTPGGDALLLHGGERINKDDDVVSVNVLDYLSSCKTTKHCLKGWRSDCIEKFENNFSDDDRLIPPYILGAWLGDGTYGRAAITKPKCKMVDEWIAYGKSIGYSCSVSKSECPTWLLTNGHEGHNFNIVQSALEFHEVATCKHIPDEYKYASAKIRREIIAGMIDSDGHITHGGCDWISKEKRLADDFVFVCRSLGLSAYISFQKKGIKETGFHGWYWRVSVSGDLSLIHMRDKIADKRMQKKRHLVHGITVEPEGVGEYYGFEIDGDNLFLLGDFTVTHNSYLGMRIIHEALKKGRSAIFVCDRTTLINQTSAVADAYGLSAHGIIQADHWRVDKSLPFQIASVQTLARRSWPEADVVVIDECFPAGTSIETPEGTKRIDDLVSGGRIYNSCGESYIISVFSKTAYATVIVRLSDGTSIECTADHPIFTDTGWRAASSLARGSRLYRKEDVQNLWQGVRTYKESDRHSCGTSCVGGIIQQTAMLREILRQEIEEPHAQPRKQEQSFGNTGEDRTQAENEGRKWNRNDGATKNDDGFIRGWSKWMDSGICGEDTKEQCARIPASLQDRFSESHLEDCHRTGRYEPLFDETEDTRREKGRITAQPWVESVEVVEHAGGINVYNLRVAGHPSYFANGILVHNCHTLYKAWTEHAANTDAKVIGLSATPFSKGMGKIFSNLVNAATMHELVEQGILVPMRVFSCAKPDMKGAATSGGEWTDAAAAERGMELIGDVVREWHEKADGKKTIVFGATVDHCEEIVRQFNESGVMAACFSYHTPDAERKEYLDEYRKHDSAIRVLASVEALAKGFDVPDVECVCDARPLRKSLSTAIQMWGRGLRSSPDTGKTECILLDFSGNIIRFMSDFEDIYFNGLSALDMGEKLDRTIRDDDEEEKKPKKCPQCGHTPFAKRCIACGYEHQAQSGIIHEPGKLTEIMVGKAKAADNPLHLWGQVCAYARSHGNPDTASGRAWHLYNHIAGHPLPRHMPRFEEMPPSPVTRATMNAIKAKQIAYRMARR